MTPTAAAARADGGRIGWLRARVPAAALCLFPPLAALAPQLVSGLLLVAAAAACVATAGRLLPPPPSRRCWPALAALVALAGWAGLSALWSITPGQSLGQAVKLLGWSAAGLVVVSAAAALDDGGDGGAARRRARSALLAGYGIALALLLVEGLSDESVTRLVAAIRGEPLTVNAANRGATTLALLLGPVLVLLWRAGRGGGGGRPAAVPALAAALTGVAVLTLNSLAAVLGLVAGMAALASVLAFRRRAAATLAAVAVAWVLATPALHLTVLRAPGPDSPLRALPVSAEHRLLAWEYAAGRMLERPLLGFGWRTYPHLDKPYDPAVFTYDVATINTALNLSHPHNLAVQIWLELGAVGALLLGLLIAATLMAAAAGADSSPRAAAARTAAVVAYLTIGAAAYGAGQSQWLATAWLVGAALALLDDRPSAAGRSGKA